MPRGYAHPAPHRAASSGQGGHLRPHSPPRLASTLRPMLRGVLDQLGELGNLVPRYTQPRCLL
ncbi:MAG: hypothetical protein Q4C89_13450, partial [Deinococcus sp.]|uniref:hypothetical protein n=1 Tax=Deinococcus sp. TaxID=47478 RepID=UPI0026DB7F37